MLFCYCSSSSSSSSSVAIQSSCGLPFLKNDVTHDVATHSHGRCSYQVFALFFDPLQLSNRTAARRKIKLIICSWLCAVFFLCAKSLSLNIEKTSSCAIKFNSLAWFRDVIVIDEVISRRFMLIPLTLLVQCCARKNTLARSGNKNGS